ncbi:MAG: polymerase, sigma-24 subunit, subfamily [Clostridia bacterium]|jgi:RNA polymerase sigma-70 factor (ECF subfamily)|nr:polymerase, sigma-24 subunit, subfamily [Clostridia bacterium]
MKKNKMYGVLEDFIIQNKESHYRLAYSYTKNKEDALDIVQESILKALNSVDSLANAEHIKTWFYRILVNTSLDVLRKKGKLSYVEDIVLEMNSEEKVDIYENFDLQNAMDNLPHHYRLIISFRYFEDLKLEEIAAILGENLNTVKTQLYAGLKRLRIEMEV